MSVDDLLRPGALFQGRFRIERPLGRGGMGEVWAALDTTLERPVAIKVIHRELAADPRYAERFLREMKLVARVAHPNIVRLYDAGAAADGRLFMIMERAFGAPLRQRLAGGARLEVARALHYAIQIADALATAHAAALVHRDVKPENILVCDDAHARLCDFGVAKDGRGLALTRQGVVVGTSRYMAPEQIAGSADGRADLYALGVVLYEMVAGAHPYPVLDAVSGIGETDMQAAHVHFTATPLPEVLPGCPAALWRAVAKCLAKRPDDRFARAEDLAEVLRAVAHVSLSPEHPMARQILREAADAARARGVRIGAGEGEGPAKRLESTAPLPAGFVPPGPLPPGPLPPSATARERLAMAQAYRVTPAGLEPVGPPGGVTVDAAGRGAMERQAQASPGVGGSTAQEAPTEGASKLATTERWDGAAVLAGGVALLARTEPWEVAASGAGVPRGAGSPRARWKLVAVGVVVLALLATVLVAWVFGLGWG
jgi:serine/threonine-protein kinase